MHLDAADWQLRGDGWIQDIEADRGPYGETRQRAEFVLPSLEEGSVVRLRAASRVAGSSEIGFLIPVGAPAPVVIGGACSAAGGSGGVAGLLLLVGLIGVRRRR